MVMCGLVGTTGVAFHSDHYIYSLSYFTCFLFSPVPCLSVVELAL